MIFQRFTGAMFTFCPSSGRSEFHPCAPLPSPLNFLSSSPPKNFPNLPQLPNSQFSQIFIHKLLSERPHRKIFTKIKSCNLQWFFDSRIFTSRRFWLKKSYSLRILQIRPEMRFAIPQTYRSCKRAKWTKVIDHAKLDGNIWYE